MRWLGGLGTNGAAAAKATCGGAATPKKLININKDDKSQVPKIHGLLLK